MYELISAFATQKFCSFWKPISPWILYPKGKKFHQGLSFTSSLAAWSQHVSFCKQSGMEMSKTINNDISMNPPIAKEFNWTQPRAVVVIKYQQVGQLALNCNHAAILGFNLLPWGLPCAVVVLKLFESHQLHQIHNSYIHTLTPPFTISAPL